MTTFSDVVLAVIDRVWNDERAYSSFVLSEFHFEFIWLAKLENGRNPTKAKIKMLLA